MSKTDEYKRHAAECERKAQAECSPRARQQYLEMAQRWRDLAAHVRGDERNKARAAKARPVRFIEQPDEHV